MRTRFWVVLIPLWAGCGDGDGASLEAAGPAAPFEKTLLELTEWTMGACALFDDESIQCWQSGAQHAERVPRLTGRAAAGRTDIVSVGELCAVQASGEIRCVDDSCGADTKCTPDGNCPGTFDDGPCNLDGPSYAIEGLEPAAEIVLGSFGGGVALLPDGRVQPWQAAVTTCVPDEVPLNGIADPIALPSPVVAFDTKRQHSCFVTADGHVYCSGFNTENNVVPGQGECVWPPAPVPDIDDAVDVALQIDSTCVLRRSGTVTCFGWAYELGIGSGNAAFARGDALGIDDAVAIASGELGTCVIRSDRSLWCWGASLNGELGVIGNDEFGSAVLLEPRRVEPVSGASAVAMTSSMTCVVYGPNDVWCWGFVFPGGATVEPRRIRFQ